MTYFQMRQCCQDNFIVPFWKEVFSKREESAPKDPKRKLEKKKKKKKK